MHESRTLYDLARLLEADIAPVAAVQRLLKDPANDTRRLSALELDLKRGCSLARALANAGAAARLDCAILEVAAGGGKQTEALRLLADNLDRRQRRVASLRVRLWLPNFVLFVALAVNVVRAVTAGASPIDALLKAGLITAAVVIVTRIVIASLKRDASGWLALGWRFGLQRTSDLFRAYFEQLFYTLFAWQTAAGVDFVSATKPLRGLLDSRPYTAAVDRYRRSIAAGGSVARALEDAALLLPGELQQVIVSGEASGRLAAAVQHYLTIQDARLERITERIFAWLPRIYYLIVLLIGAATLF